ncbi:hypothetical protein [Maliponia aquimaris]|uniref:Uncharacterized protein n=1 Tax=Maliponia aquimaris TaxID=1673631 RepID=A0A238KDH7_9RHOB|nr:hypothetical protein [Maliponia aquimaris]SMX40870.1 hypothetical protein MAA8898_02280 [Maliponia aquimaris]
MRSQVIIIMSRTLARLLGPLLLVLALALPGAAAADCYVSYKAKQDQPLRLHYGVLVIGGSCPSGGQAANIAASRLASGGWTLLNVVRMSTSPPSSSERANAGQFYLRY